MASPTPVLRLVGCPIVAPGLSAPRRSASSIMAAAVRSFTLAPGLRASILASTRAPAGSGNRRSRTSGVPPMSSRMVSAIFVLMRLYVVHRPRGPALFLGARDEVAQRPAIHDAGHRLADLAPQLAEVGAFPRAVATAVRAAVERRVAPVHRPEDRAHGDLLGRLRQMVAARRAALGGQQAAALEREQHLLEIALRDRLARGDLLDRDQRPTPMRGEVEHGLDRVLPLGRDAHRDLSAGGCRARAGARRPWRST